MSHARSLAAVPPTSLIHLPPTTPPPGQILFYKHCPTLICDAREVNVFHSCSKSTWPSLHKPDQLASYVQHRAFDTSYRNQYHAKFLEGPFQRGLLPARHIFSSGTDGAPGAARWGATEDEWAADEPARKRLQRATKKAVLADPAQCARVYDRSRGKMAVADDVYADLVVFDDLNAAELQCVSRLACPATHPAAC